jgi:hypothetical protein
MQTQQWIHTLSVFLDGVNSRYNCGLSDSHCRDSMTEITRIQKSLSPLYNSGFSTQRQVKAVVCLHSGLREVPVWLSAIHRYVLLFLFVLIQRFMFYLLMVMIQRACPCCYEPHEVWNFASILTY